MKRIVPLFRVRFIDSDDHNPARAGGCGPHDVHRPVPHPPERQLARKRPCRPDSVQWSSHCLKSPARRPLKYSALTSVARHAAGCPAGRVKSWRNIKTLEFRIACVATRIIWSAPTPNSNVVAASCATRVSCPHAGDHGRERTKADERIRRRPSPTSKNTPEPRINSTSSRRRAPGQIECPWPVAPPCLGSSNR